jgi:hypothetical protein
MRRRTNTSRGTAGRGVREHIGPHPFVRLPVRPAAAAGTDVPEPFDLPPARTPSDTR